MHKNKEKAQNNNLQKEIHWLKSGANKVPENSSNKNPQGLLSVPKVLTSQKPNR